MATLSFSKQLDSEVKELGKRGSKAVTNAAKTMFSNAVRDTPFRTGRLANGYRLSTIRRTSYVPRERIFTSKPNQPNFRYAVTKHKRFYFFNNVPYAYYIEHGKGPGSRKAHYMFRNAVARFEVDLQRRFNAIRGIK